MIPCVVDRSAPEAQVLLDQALPGGLARRNAVYALLNRAPGQGWLRTLDVAFAGFLWSEQPTAHPDLILAAALASYQLGRGHVCLDLEQTLADPMATLGWPSEGLTEGLASGLAALRRVLQGITPESWRRAMADSPLLQGDGPLACDGQRLYLRRYQVCEQELADYLSQTWSGADIDPPDPARLRKYLDRLFPGRLAEATDWQKVACALAVRQRFSVITGGPGTGKTTTVVKLLALLQAMALAERGQPGLIRMAAPTGKAAARLKEAIGQAVSALDLAGLVIDGKDRAEAIRQAIPTQVDTLHRLLGSQPGRLGFRFDADNPLTLDVLVVDEASMVDLELLAATLRALPKGCRLILLGDKDQLASVEAGAVLGELCAQADAGHYWPEVANWLVAACGESLPTTMIDPAGRSLDQCITKLRYSYRFAAKSGIGRLAQAVNAADAEDAYAVLDDPSHEITFLNPTDHHDITLRAIVLNGGVHDAPSKTGGYRAYLLLLRTNQPGPEDSSEVYDAWASQVLQAFGQFQLLAAVRSGPWGVENLNDWMAGLLSREGLIEPAGPWYLGRPVMVTQNNYELGVMNGDIGITLYRIEGGTRRLRVAFPDGDGSGAIKWVLPSHLNAVETVYAMTVHKSQGSEFNHAVLILPRDDSPVLTRELIYTAITRARGKLAIVQPKDANTFDLAVSRQVHRASGISARLKGL